MHRHIPNFIGGQIPIDRRVHDRVVPEEHALLRLAVPAARVLLVGRVVLVVDAERAEERRLVVGRAPHPAVRDLGPFGDAVARGDQVIDRLRCAEEWVGEASVPRIGRHDQAAFGGIIGVQGVVHSGDHPRRVAERRMHGHVLDLLAVDVDAAAVAQALKVLITGERQCGLRLTHIKLLVVLSPIRHFSR